MVGQSLTELVVALAVTLLVVGGALGVVVPASHGFTAIPEHGDLQQRLRTAVDALRSDLLRSSGGPIPHRDQAAADAWPRVTPCGWGRDPATAATGPCARADALGVVLAERELWLAVEGPAAGDALAVVPLPGCPAGEPGCVFAPGDAVVLADGHGRTAALRVSHAEPGLVTMPLVWSYGTTVTGATLASGSVRAYYVRPDATTGLLQLRRQDNGSDQPVTDHLSEFSVEYFGAADPPVVDDHTGLASYGPAPVRNSPGSGEAAGWVPSCAFSLDGGHPVSTLQPRPAGSDGLARLPLESFLDGPWCPDPASPWRVDLDVYRVTRLRVRLGVAAASSAARGTSRAWFARPGSATHAGRLVPDLAVAFDVWLRGTGR